MHLWPVETRSFHRGSTTRNNQNAGVSLRECLLHEWTILWPDEAEISRSWAPRNSERVQFFSVNRPDFHRNRSTSTDLSKKAWEIRRLKLLAPSFGPRVAIFCFSARTLAASSRACLTCYIYYGLIFSTWFVVVTHTFKMYRSTFAQKQGLKELHSERKYH